MSYGMLRQIECLPHGWMRDLAFGAYIVTIGMIVVASLSFLALLFLHGVGVIG